MVAGSDELADELGLESPPDVFTPARATAAVDAWLERAGPLDEEDATRLGLFLARVLLEAHGGGLAQIREPGHPLDGEWTVTAFERKLARDYHVPFFVSAYRVGVDRSLSAAAWYSQLAIEGARE